MNSEETYPITLKTYAGFEHILANEVRSLGYDNVRELNRAVQFEGGKMAVYRCNYWLRTALSVLRNIANFTITDRDSLYEQSKQIPWDKYISLDQTFAINTSINTDLFDHTKFPALVMKDALADYFTERSGRRPSVDKENPDVEFDLHIGANHVNISVNTSGEPLYKRGYRVTTHEAPLNEVVAAGLVALSGWQPHVPLLDPMCGSGTIAIEAALMGLNIPPGKFRERFKFQGMADFDRKLWREAKRKGPENVLKAESVRIIAADIKENFVDFAKRNAMEAGVNDQIEFRTNSFFFSDYPFKGILIMNPPYGIRMEEDIPAFYEEIGDTLKNDYAESKAWIFSAAEEGHKHIGLKAFKKIKLYNAHLPSWFYGYEMYEGSRKTS